MKAQRSWRNRYAYMLAGEGAILVLCFLWFTLSHTLVGSSKNLDVRSTERKLERLNCGRASFNFVDPVKELSHGCVIAAGGFCRELHRRGLDLRDLPSLPAHGGADLVACGLHDQGAEIFRALRPTLCIAACTFPKLRVLGRVTAADLSCAFAVR